LLPSIAVLALFSFYPITSVFKLSFFRWENMSPDKIFIGFDNYIRLFSDDRFWNSMVVTLKYTLIVTTLSILLGLFLAVILNNRYLVMKSFWRSLYFLPAVTPTVAVAMVWMLIFNPGFGFVNVVLRQFNIPGPNWLADPHWALPTLMTLGVWRRMGFNLIIYLAALQAIPLELYESAQVDGATSWHQFWKITLPLVKPTTILLVILGVIDSFLVFDQVLVLTHGGPAGATEVIGQYMYTTAFSLFKMGYGSTISVVMFIVIAIFTLFQWRFVGFGSTAIED
jgi:multiple sugar transport system permease protein